MGKNKLASIVIESVIAQEIIDKIERKIPCEPSEYQEISRSLETSNQLLYNYLTANNIYFSKIQRGANCVVEVLEILKLKNLPFIRQIRDLSTNEII